MKYTFSLLPRFFLACDETLTAEPKPVGNETTPSLVISATDPLILKSNFVILVRFSVSTLSTAFTLMQELLVKRKVSPIESRSGILIALGMISLTRPLAVSLSLSPFSLIPIFASPSVVTLRLKGTPLPSGWCNTPLVPKPFDP